MTTTDSELEKSVKRMRVGEHYVFVIGGIGQERLTVYSQQIRALNLIYWLYCQDQRDQLLRKDQAEPDLVVIGAGIAGLTAAAAAARLEKTVWILEAQERALALQRGCRHRLLHPHVYEWPDKGCWKVSAGLPILDWEEASAAEVADRIWGQFRAVQVKTDIKTYTSLRKVRVDFPEGSQNPRVTWENPASAPEGQPTKAEPPIVILAVGFGVEKTVPDLPVLSYWRDDPLDQAPLPRRTVEYTQIVSGPGDGGLVDVLRAALKDFDHIQFFSNLATITRGSGLEDHLRKKDWELAGETPQRAASILAKHYKDLDEIVDNLKDDPKGYKVALDCVETLIKAHTRKNHKVIWLHKEESPWTWKSMCLNRFLVSRVMHVDKQLVQPKQGTLLSSKLLDPALSGGFSFVACVLGPDEKAEAILAHSVTVRHGAEPALKEFPNILEIWNREHPRPETEKVELPDLLKPVAYWKDDTKFKEDLKERSSSVTPEILRVKIVGQPNPVEVEGKAYYRLIVYLHEPPQHVSRVTYDLHPSWRRIERPVSLEAAHEEPPAEGENRLAFAKLIHTYTGWCAKKEEHYQVRIRLNDGDEITTSLVCAICREYESEKDKLRKGEAVKIVNKLSCGHHCLDCPLRR